MGSQLVDTNESSAYIRWFQVTTDETVRITLWI